MDWGSWSPSHTILVLFIVASFIGQVAVYFHRTSQNDKKIDKQGEMFFHALERLEDRMDKRLSDMQAETNPRFTEMNQRLSDIEGNLRQLNQNHIEHLNRHHSE